MSLQNRLFDDDEPIKKRRCPKCVTWKIHADFDPDRTTKSGLHAWCTKCSREKTNNHRIKTLRQRTLQDATRSSSVYFLKMIRTDGKILYKIGFTENDVSKRLSKLQNALPFDDITFLASHRGGTRNLECLLKLINARFRQYPRRGFRATEWFDFKNEKAAIKAFMEIRPYVDVYRPLEEIEELFAKCAFCPTFNKTHLAQWNSLFYRIDSGTESFDAILADAKVMADLLLAGICRTSRFTDAFNAFHKKVDAMKPGDVFVDFRDRGRYI